MKSDNKVSYEIEKLQYQVERFNHMKSTGFNTISNRDDDKYRKSKSYKVG